MVGDLPWACRGEGWSLLQQGLLADRAVWLSTHIIEVQDAQALLLITAGRTDKQAALARKWRQQLRRRPLMCAAPLQEGGRHDMVSAGQTTSYLIAIHRLHKAQRSRRAKGVPNFLL
jgi:hypothetical protein